MLHTAHYPGPAATPLVIAHGLFGSARNWNVIAKRLSDTRPVIAVDMRNHGQSPWFDTQSYHDMASDLAEVIEREADGRADVLGHSMGGKAAMVLAVTHSELVRKLIVADIAPVGYSHTQVHLIDAMRAVNLGTIASRQDAARLLDVDNPGIASFLLQSLNLSERRWRLNLDVLEAEMPRIIGFPDVTGTFEGSVLSLAGGASDYVTKDARDISKSLFPNINFAKIPGAGHWLHAEKPREFEAAVRAYLG